MYVLKGLKLKWLENVQMRDDFASAETAEVAHARLTDGGQVQNAKHLASDAPFVARIGGARCINGDPRGLYHT
jgi:hypothetical protein